MEANIEMAPIHFWFLLLTYVLTWNWKVK